MEVSELLSGEIKWINLLSEEEKTAVLNVLARNNGLQKLEEQRIGYLQKRLETLSANKANEPNAEWKINILKICPKCKDLFALLFSGDIFCQECRMQICKNCVYCFKNNQIILCQPCYRQILFEAKSGNWFCKRIINDTDNFDDTVSHSNLLLNTLWHRLQSVNSSMHHEANISYAFDDWRVPADEIERRSYNPYKDHGRFVERETYAQGADYNDDWRIANDELEMEGLNPYRDHGRFEERRAYEQGTNSNDDWRVANDELEMDSLNVYRDHGRFADRQAYEEGAISNDDWRIANEELEMENVHMYTDQRRYIERRDSPRSTHSNNWRSGNEEHEKATLPAYKNHGRFTQRQASPAGANSNNWTAPNEENQKQTLQVYKDNGRPMQRQPVPGRPNSSTAADWKVPNEEIEKQSLNSYKDQERSIERQASPGITNSNEWRAPTEETEKQSLGSYKEQERSIERQTSPGGTNSNLDLLDAEVRSHGGASNESVVTYHSEGTQSVHEVEKGDGEIEIKLDYDFRSTVFHVTILRCRHLNISGDNLTLCNPFVTVFLLPDKSRSSKRKTKIKKQTNSPEFHEDFKYFIEKSALESRTLSITVWHKTERFSVDICLGEISIPLDFCDFKSTEAQWYLLREKSPNIIRRGNISYKGDLNLAIKYVTPSNINITDLRKLSSKGELLVWIKGARNLSILNPSRECNPFVKMYFLPDKTNATKRRSSTAKRTNDPKWNVILKYEDLSFEGLDDRGLEISVWNQERLGRKTFVGGVRLNLGPGYPERADIDWMDASGPEFRMWCGLLSRPNVWIDGSIPLRSSMD